MHRFLNLFAIHLKLTQYGKSAMHVCVLSWVQFFTTLWMVAHQVPLSMVFPRLESWSGLPFPPPGDLPNPGIETSLAGRFFITAPIYFSFKKEWVFW